MGDMIDKPTILKKLAPVKISLRTVCHVALLIALAFVLERLLPIVNLGYARLTFAFIPMMCCGMLFGPLWGAAAYGIADVLGWPIMGLTPIPLVLLSRVAGGFIFGFILYRENLRFTPHAFITAFTEQIVCSACLATLGLTLPPSFYHGISFSALLYSRLPFIAAYIVLQLAVFPLLVRVRVVLQKAGIVIE